MAGIEPGWANTTTFKAVKVALDAILEVCIAPLNQHARQRLPATDEANRRFTQPDSWLCSRPPRPIQLRPSQL